MATTESIPKTYEQAVSLLARWQGDGGPSDLNVFAFPDVDQQEVRVLQASETFPDLGGVRVYKMGRSEEYPFRSAVALAHSKYWERIQAGAELLPAGWDPKTAYRVWPDDRT